MSKKRHYSCKTTKMTRNITTSENPTCSQIKNFWSIDLGFSSTIKMKAIFKLFSVFGGQFGAMEKRPHFSENISLFSWFLHLGMIYSQTFSYEGGGVLEFKNTRHCVVLRRNHVFWCHTSRYPHWRASVAFSELLTFISELSRRF